MGGSLKRGQFSPKDTNGSFLSLLFANAPSLVFSGIMVVYFAIVRGAYFKLAFLREG